MLLQPGVPSFNTVLDNAKLVDQAARQELLLMLYVWLISFAQSMIVTSFYCLYVLVA